MSSAKLVRQNTHERAIAETFLWAVGKLFTPLLIQPHNISMGACPGFIDEEGEGSGLPSLYMSYLTRSHLSDCKASRLLSTLRCPALARLPELEVSAPVWEPTQGCRARSAFLPWLACPFLSSRLKDLSVPPTGPWIHSVPSTAWASAGPNLYQQALSHFLPHQDSLL